MTFEKTGILMRAFAPGEEKRLQWEGHIAAEKDRRRHQSEGLFNPDPDDLVRDARSGVDVSRQGKDRGARKQEFYEEEVFVDGRRENAQVIKDGIYRMKEKGNISEQAFRAARKFQEEFDRCGYGHYSSINLNATGHGNMGIEDVLARAQGSRDYVHHVLKLLGGPNNPMSSVAFWYMGMGKGFDQIVEAEGDSKHYWRGVFFAAIRLMEDDYVRRCTVKRRNIRSSGF